MFATLHHYPAPPLKRCQTCITRSIPDAPQRVGTALARLGPLQVMPSSIWDAFFYFDQPMGHHRNNHTADALAQTCHFPRFLPQMKGRRWEAGQSKTANDNCAHKVGAWAGGGIHQLFKPAVLPRDLFSAFMTTMAAATAATSFNIRRPFLDYFRAQLPPTTTKKKWSKVMLHYSPKHQTPHLLVGGQEAEGIR